MPGRSNCGRTILAVGKGAGAGVLINSAEALERLEKVSVLIVDKTGTLTEGRPSVSAIVPAADLTEAEILGLAASLERSSEHPLASAILAAAASAGSATMPARGFASITGCCTIWALTASPSGVTPLGAREFNDRLEIEEVRA